MQRTQTASAATRPRLLQAMVDAWRQPDVRAKIVFTLAILVAFRFTAHVPLPGVDLIQLRNALDNNPVLGFLNLFSGGGLSKLSIVALGVYPYITASIVIQLLTPLLPRLQRLGQEGEQGRNKIQLYTYWLAVPMAIVQGYGQLLLLANANAISGISLSGGQALPTLSAIISMAAGTMFLVWLGELITEKGIGNGLSIIIFGGILAGFPTTLNSIRRSDTGVTGIFVVFVIAVLLIAAIVFVQEAQRRIPVQYARSVFRGGRMYRQSGQSHIPLRVNSAGMIPLIFAFSIIILPSVVAGYIVGAAHESNTQIRQQLPFAVDDANKPLAEAFPKDASPRLEPEGAFRVNKGEFPYVAAQDTFNDLVDRINRDSRANVLTFLETDPTTGAPTWTIEANKPGKKLIDLKDLSSGNFIAATHLPVGVTDDPLTPDFVEGQTPGQRLPWYGRAGDWVQTNFSPGRPLYWALSFILVVVFTFFYTLITFQQQNLAENLQKQGGFVPGIRPGRPTQDYITRVLMRITWGGALFLGLVAVAPFLATKFIPDSQALTLSSTGLLIVVGVALDTMKQVEAQLLMRHYEGFIR